MSKRTLFSLAMASSLFILSTAESSKAQISLNLEGEPTEMYSLPSNLDLRASIMTSTPNQMVDLYAEDPVSKAPLLMGRQLTNSAGIANFSFNLTGAAAPNQYSRVSSRLIAFSHNTQSFSELSQAYFYGAETRPLLSEIGSSRVGGAIVPGLPQTGKETFRDVKFTDPSGGYIVAAGASNSHNLQVSNGSITPGTRQSFFDGLIAILDRQGQTRELLAFGAQNYERFYSVDVGSDRRTYYAAGRGGPGMTLTGFQPHFVGGPTSSIYGQQNGVIVKVKHEPSGAQIVASTYLGSDPNGEGGVIRRLKVAKDDTIGEDAVFISGAVIDIDTNYIRSLTPNVHFYGGVGTSANFVARVNENLDQLEWIAFFQGNDIHGPPSIETYRAPDGTLHPVVSFTTQATNLPRTTNRLPAGGSDIYIARLSPDGSSVEMGAYAGGDGQEEAETHNLGLDVDGDAVVCVASNSRNIPGYKPLPNSPRNYQGPSGPVTSNYFGDNLCSFFEFDGSVAAITRFGGTGREGVEGVTLLNETVYISGTTDSTDFFGMANQNHGGWDGFIVKLRLDNQNQPQLVEARYVGTSHDEYARTSTIAENGDTALAGPVFTNTNLATQGFITRLAPN